MDIHPTPSEIQNALQGLPLPRKVHVLGLPLLVVWLSVEIWNICVEGPYSVSLWRSQFLGYKISVVRACDCPLRDTAHEHSVIL
jgi:hypothetical protein